MSNAQSFSKALSARLKSKGLKRLRWYCQMCEKQCRDENGFQCHTRSESHLRQMALFQQRPDQFVEQFSAEFVRGFIALLQRCGGRSVKANSVYQDYIRDKSHTHMNATQWDSLSSFVSYLGKQKLAEVRVDDEGQLWIKFIDTDVRRQERAKELEREAARETQRQESERLRVEAEARAALQRRKECEREHSTDMAQNAQPASPADLAAERSGPVTLNVSSTNNSCTVPTVAKPIAFDAANQPSQLFAASKAASSAGIGSKRAIDSLLSELQVVKRVHQSWLAVGLVVRVLNASLANGTYHRAKGRVVCVLDRFVAELSMLDATLPNIKIDERELETVIPALGGTVLVVKGGHRGQRAKLLSLSDDQRSASIECTDPRETLHAVQLDAICKVVD